MGVWWGESLGEQGAKEQLVQRHKKHVSIKERGTWISLPWMTCRLREELSWRRRLKFFSEARFKKKKIKFPTCQNMTSWEFDFCIEKSRDRCRFINRGMIFSNLYFRNVIPLSTKWKCTGGDNARGRRRAVRKLIVGNWRKTRESPDRSGEKGDANNTKKVEQI